MYKLQRKIIIKQRNKARGTRGEFRTVMLGEFSRIEHAEQVMQLMSDYGAGYGLYIHVPRYHAVAAALLREEMTGEN